MALRVVRKQERDTPVQQDLKDNTVVDTEIENNESDEVVKDAENDTDLIFHLSTNRFVQFQRGIVYDKNIKKMSEIAVYVMLCESRYGKTYSAKISVATLADKARCDARTVRAAIKVLKQFGYIEDIVEGGGKKKPNIYTLTKEPVMCEMQPKAAILTKTRMENALNQREDLIANGIIPADDKDVYFRWNKGENGEKNFRLTDSEGHTVWQDNFYSSAPSTKVDTTEIEKPIEKPQEDNVENETPKKKSFKKSGDFTPCTMESLRELAKTYCEMKERNGKKAYVLPISMIPNKKLQQTFYEWLEQSHIESYNDMKFTYPEYIEFARKIGAEFHVKKG